MASLGAPEGVDPLAALQLIDDPRLVEPDEVEEAGSVSESRLDDRHATADPPLVDGEDLAADGDALSGSDAADFDEQRAILQPPREVEEEILDRPDPKTFESLGPLLADPLERRDGPIERRGRAPSVLFPVEQGQDRGNRTPTIRFRRTCVPLHERRRLREVLPEKGLETAHRGGIEEARRSFQGKDLAHDVLRSAVPLWHIGVNHIMPATDKQGETMDIRTYGDPVLRRTAKPVETIDDEIRDICRRMVEEMLRADGVGLAAPQIGIPLRIIVLDVEGEFHVLINPELLFVSEETETGIEGCLSVPGVHAEVARSAQATIAGTTLGGERVEITGEGLLARAMQHEMDHINGHLFVDHVSQVKRRSLIKEFERKKRESEE